ncbi:MAG: ATP-binding cassette domain-containing protein [Pseudomonadota bacterium]
MLDVSIQGRLGTFDLDIAFQAGNGVTALFGPSGAGKSSVLRAIAGLWRPSGGWIRIGERVLFDHGQGVDMPVARRRMGVVFQDPLLFPHMSVEKNLAYGFCGDRVLWDHIVSVLDLQALLSRMPRHLSGGEMQRVSLARALVSDPSVLLLDEPLTGLDEGRRNHLLPFLERLRDESTVPIIYVSHHREEIVRLADLVFVVESGTVSEELTPTELQKRAALGVRTESAMPHVEKGA